MYLKDKFAATDTFVDNGDGTVTDTNTGLMWMRPALGQAWDGKNGFYGKIGDTYLSWEDAKAIVHHFAGYSDWRLPNLDELSSIVDMSQSQSSINPIFPTPTISAFWSATRLTGSSTEAWVVDFRWDGNLRTRELWNPATTVRLVRGGNTLDNLSKSDFCDNGNGTVTDRSTGLTWMRCAVGQTWDGSDCVGEPKRYNWDEAMSTSHKIADYDGWRLPSIGELNTIVDRGRISPSADDKAFPNMQRVQYWTSTSSVRDVSQARTIDFWNGETWLASKTSGNIVRLVRGATNSIALLDTAKSLANGSSSNSLFLSITKTGSGSGDVVGSYSGETFKFGKTVNLVAHASDGSIFNGWSGDATGLDASCMITMDTAKSVTAEFTRVNIPDLPIGIAFDSAKTGSMKSGDDAFILYFSIANKGQKQIRIELPLSNYVTRYREEIEQDAWLTGHVNGAKGATIGPGAFRKAGLVYFQSKLNGISAGDQLSVTVSQVKPSRRFNFSFRCTDSKSLAFTLINAVAEEEQVQEEAIATVSAILQRIELLEAGLSAVLRKLETLQVTPPAVIGKTSDKNLPVKTLTHALAWLVTQDRIAVSELRSLLLPLDLLPSAVIERINEKALDLTGDPALEESEDEIVVTRTVLKEVVAVWENE